MTINYLKNRISITYFTRNTWILVVILLTGFLVSCKTEKEETVVVVSRLADDPEGLNPILVQSSLAVQVVQKIFSSLYEQDPISLAESPLLAKAINEAVQVDTGKYANLMRLNIEILEDAEWDDDEAVTVEDVFFSIKATLICDLYGSGASGMDLSSIKLETDDVEGKSFSIYYPKSDDLNHQLITALPIIPSHIYDSSEVIKGFPIDRFLDLKKLESFYKQNKTLAAFAESFSSSIYSREKISGSGSYELADWQTGQYILLRKKKNHWTEEFQGKRHSFTAYPDEIVFKIIPDEQTAIAALKAGALDIMGDFSPEQYSALRKDTTLLKDISLYEPEVLQYFYMALNNDHPALASLEVRRAIARVFDMQLIIDSLFEGLATRIPSPIHPRKSYFNKDLKPVDFNIEEAKDLLQKDGWKDSNKNGILDKTINGQLQELQFDLLTSQRKLGQDLALMFQQNAEEAGIRIDITAVDNTTLISNVRNREFDMANLAGRFPVQSDEEQLYITWHSDATATGGNNFMNFRNTQVDSLIQVARSQQAGEDQEKTFLEIQKLIYEQQPVVFLVAPLERIAARKHLNVETSIVRPGYYENLIRPK
jgi:peptide/nickel transport system substrate-binding protein